MKINDLIKNYIKNGDKILTEGYRSVKSKMLFEQKKGGEAPDETKLFLESVKREIKERVESNSYIKDESNEEFKKNKLVITALEQHLPKKLSADEQQKLVEQAVKDADAKDRKDFGKVMKLLSAHREVLDMPLVSNRVRELLSGN